MRENINTNMHCFNTHPRISQTCQVRQPHRGQQAVRVPPAFPPPAWDSGGPGRPRGFPPPLVPPPPCNMPGLCGIGLGFAFAAQKAPAGHFSGSKYNFICPKGPCGTTFCYSQSEIYDIGTEIIFFHCFATKIIKSFYKSIFLEESESSRRDRAFYSIET